MELNAIVTEICRQADDFLAGVARRDEARAGISEWLTINYASLTPSAKKAVVDQSMRVLDHEGFFDMAAGAQEGESDDDAGED
jgi:hypothetical protein